MAEVLATKSRALEVRAPSDFVDAFASMTRERDGALFVSSDPLISHHRQRIVALAGESHIPAIYMHTHFKDAKIVRRRIRTAPCHCLIL